ncbi:MAG: class E sortase [Actinomycetota bacterium]|nr:class E sortase [Actinomycetota bacterium]
MLVSRIFRRLGQSLVGVGVLTLLFVAYQLWGTGFLTDRYQDDLKEEFEELVETVEETSSESFNVVEEVEEEEEEESSYASFLWRSEGKAIAQMIIPKMGMTQTVVSGVTSESLRRGPGHYQNTPMPGMPGNAAIAGHRTTWGAPFSNIDELEPGDEINVQTIQGNFTYKVVEQSGGRGNFIVSPQRLDVLDQNFEEYPNRLTLISCHPKLTARNRIVVVAELIGEPAEFFERPGSSGQTGFAFAFDADVIAEATSGEGATTIQENAEGVSTSSTETKLPEEIPEDTLQIETPEKTSENIGTVEEQTSEATENTGNATVARATSFGEGLNGDRSAILPSITWGLALLALVISSVFVSNRWKKWPTYVITFFPFVVVLSIWFFNLDRALPSY